MVKEVREFYNIKQEMLAAYLGVSRSHLSMVELGKRDLHPTKKLKLLKLYEAMFAPDSSELPQTTDKVRLQKSRMAAVAVKMIEKNDQRLANADAALKACRETHLQTGKALAILGRLKAAAEPTEQKFMQIMAKMTEVKYNSSGPEMQLKLEMRIAAIKAETALLKKKKL